VFSSLAVLWQSTVELVRAGSKHGILIVYNEVETINSGMLVMMSDVVNERHHSLLELALPE